VEAVVEVNNAVHMLDIGWLIIVLPSLAIASMLLASMWIARGILVLVEVEELQDWRHQLPEKFPLMGPFPEMEASTTLLLCLIIRLVLPSQFPEIVLQKNLAVVPLAPVPRIALALGL
jgi:hypothetical protein